MRVPLSATLILTIALLMTGLWLCPGTAHGQPGATTPSERLGVATSAPYEPVKPWTSFMQGDVRLSAGVGAGNIYQNIVLPLVATRLREGRVYDRSLFQLKAEYALTDVIGIGLSVNLARGKLGFTQWLALPGQDTISDYRQVFRYTTLSSLIRVNGHFIRTERTDVYGGVGLGLRLARKTFSIDFPGAPRPADLRVPSLFPIGVELTVGARYWVIPRVLAVYGEAGLAQALVQAGVTVGLSTRPREETRRRN